MIRLLGFIDDFLGSIFKRVGLATAVNTEQLALFRIFYGGLLLCYFLPSWSWLNDVPPGFFDPQLLSFAYLTDDYLPDVVYILSDVLVVVVLLLITLGIHTRKCLLLMFVVCAILFSYSFSFGKVDHYTNLFLFTYPALAFTNSGTKYAIRKDRVLPQSTQETALIVMGIIIAFGYFSAGLVKCLHWIDFDQGSSGFYDWLIYSFFNSENQSLFAPYLFQLPVYLFEPLDYLAALFEVSGFFFLLKGRKYWLFYLTLASLFHLANLLTLNLSFALNVLCYGIFIIGPILALFHKRQHVIFSKYKKLLMIGVIGIALIKIVLILSDLPVENYHNYAPLLNFELTMDILLWVFTIICGIYLLRSRTKTNKKYNYE